MSTTILGTSIKQSFCEYIYYPPFFPHFGKESAFSLITICLEFLILLFLLSCILRKKWYQCRGLENEARSLLLPFYDRVLYYYALVTLMRILFYLSQFIYEIITPSNTRDIEYVSPIWIIIGDAAGEIGIIGLEIFILFLLMQTSAGTKAYKRAYRATILVCLLQICIILFKNLYGAQSQHYLLFCLGEIAEESVLFLIFIGVTIYCYFYQVVKHRKRERNRILYGYILSLSLLNLLLITAYLLLIFKIDGYCLDILEQYLFRLLFPWIAFITIRSDSEFWRMLLLSWQTSSSKAYGEKNHNGGDDDDEDNLFNKIKSIFGIANAHKPSFNDPLMDALSLGVKMVDFTELREKSDPFAMGSTATVSTAKLCGEIVAVKVFIFDELSMETISEFFRESLLISNLHHCNIVEFKGACLRPPELCLVYEYCCCGDLTHLILTQFFHPQSLKQNNNNNNNETREDPKLFKHRIKMLLDVARGMTRLHDSGIIHRDLKTSNVLVHFESNKGYIAKVCDFGSARKILSNSDANHSKKAYVAPAAPKKHDLEYAKSVDSHLKKNKRKKKKKKKKIKKHEIVIEKEKKEKKHKRAHTITITSNIKNIFRKKSSNADETKKKKHKKDSKSAQLQRLEIERMRVLSNSTQQQSPTADDNEEEEEMQQTVHLNPSTAKHKNKRSHAKTSINYYDIDEEEKYDKPQYKTDAGDKRGEDYDDDDDDNETIITTMNYDGTQTVNNNRDPTKLAFSVSPILLTTQVGTLAFMAPEIMSHVNIGALSGGWQNKENDSNNDDNDNDNNIKIEEWKEEEEEIENKNINETVVIKISTASISTTSDVNYARITQKEEEDRQNHAKIVPQPISTATPTNKQKQKLFTREYINKHLELTSKKQNDQVIIATPPPQKQLPPNPLKAPAAHAAAQRSRNISIVSQGLKRMFTASSFASDKNLSWQNRDIFAYNSSYKQAPFYHSPSSMRYSIALNKAAAGQNLAIEPQNIQNYALRELPPDPPKTSKNKKSKYFSRGRTSSKYSVRSHHTSKNRRRSIKSQLSVMDAVDQDAAKSIIYETQQFEIVYEASDNALYDDSVDVYSFAVIMWEIALCNRIYNEMDMKMIRDLVCEGQRMPIPTFKQCKSKKYKKKEKYALSNVKLEVYQPLIQLINKCWAQSPVDRPKFYEIQKELKNINTLHLLQ